MRFKPQIDGFDLELVGSVDTGIEKAIAEYEVPFADGGILDDMGVKARRFQIRTIWRRDNYEAHEDFIEHTKLPEMNRFVHPELGAINGRIKSINVVHNDRRSCAEISIEFLEDVNPDVQPAYNPPLEAILEEGFIDIVEALIDTATADLAAEGLDTAVVVDPDKSLGGQLRGLMVSARLFVARLDQAISKLKATYNNAMNGIDSVVAMITFAANLPGVVIGAIARTVERLTRVAEGVRNAPGIFVASMRAGLGDLHNAVPMLRDSISIAGASIGAVAMGKMLIADETNKAVLRRIENVSQWRDDGTTLNMPSVPAVLTAGELDAALTGIREIIQEGITAARSIGSAAAAAALSRQADELTRYINTVKLERDRIVIVEVEEETPLHLLCLRRGLPYTYADRICTINDFYNPTFCVGAVRLYG